VTLFYATYGQKITVLDIIGLTLIVISVFDISIGGEWEREREDPRNGTDDEPIDRMEEHKDLAISVILAINAGLIQAFSALQINYIEKNHEKMSQVQVVIDSLLILAICLAPFFIWTIINQDPDQPQYDMR
jgi:drug/metabolite transporter (DMT)-like permease